MEEICGKLEDTLKRTATGAVGSGVMDMINQLENRKRLQNATKKIGKLMGIGLLGGGGKKGGGMAAMFGGEGAKAAPAASPVVRDGKHNEEGSLASGSTHVDADKMQAEAEKAKEMLEEERKKKEQEAKEEEQRKKEEEATEAIRVAEEQKKLAEEAAARAAEQQREYDKDLEKRVREELEAKMKAEMEEVMKKQQEELERHAEEERKKLEEQVSVGEERSDELRRRLHGTSASISIVPSVNSLL